MNEGTSYEEYLDRYGRLTYSSVGVSMLPLLRQGRDLFIIERKGRERCRAGDVVLYRRPPDKYVLHRIVRVRLDDYVILGDNCIHKEYGIRDEDIIGVMTGFVRDGREHSVKEAGYMTYSFLQLYLSPVRISLTKAAFRLRRLIH